jgi:sn1-specific diacylglycerol lipase
VRKTLEANMHFTELYPPGTVLWATALVRSLAISGWRSPFDRNLSQPQPLDDVGTIPELNLYEVKKVEAVFNQITFAQDMLRYLLPSSNSTLLMTFLALICLKLMIEYYTSSFKDRIHLF